MLESLFGTGKLEKMHIVALKPVVNPGDPPEAEDKDVEKFEVQVNPDSYSVSHYVQYENDNATGSPGVNPKYDRTLPTSLDFTIIFDGTGVIPPAPELDNVPIVGAIASLFSDKKSTDVMNQIKKFSEVVYDFKEDVHQPRRLRLTWGRQIYIGVLTSMSLNYKLFDANGTPLRVEARVSFQSVLFDITRESGFKVASPDLTHKRTVLAGDTLPLMTHRIYGTPKYYIEVARTNRIFNFRKLKEGGAVFFPPTKKSAK